MTQYETRPRIKLGTFGLADERSTTELSLLILPPEVASSAYTHFLERDVFYLPAEIVHASCTYFHGRGILMFMQYPKAWRKMHDIFEITL